MISAVSKAGPSYVGPTEKMVRTSLLNDEYEAMKSRNENRMNKHSLAGRLMTIVSDACFRSTRDRSANYQLVTKFVGMFNTDSRDGDEDDVNYFINDELHKCISAAKDMIPNKSYTSDEGGLVSESTNSDY